MTPPGAGLEYPGEPLAPPPPGDGVILSRSGRRAKEPSTGTMTGTSLLLLSAILYSCHAVTLSRCHAAFNVCVSQSEKQHEKVKSLVAAAALWTSIMLVSNFV